MAGMPFRADLQTLRHRRMTPFEASIKTDTAHVESVREFRGRVMSIIDKLSAVSRARGQLNQSLDEGAQKLMDRYAEADRKADNAFHQHHARLDAEEKEIADIEASITMLSNNLGNLPNA